MTHPPFFARVGMALIVIASTCGKARGQETARQIFITDVPVAQMRFLYAHMRTEFAGCLYGRIHGDTVLINGFANSVADPRMASDSTVVQGDCVNFGPGVKLVALAHSHMRNGSTCRPSHGQGTNRAGNDSAALEAWHNVVAFAVIMCARGDSLTFFAPGWMQTIGVPSLDSLYARNP